MRHPVKAEQSIHHSVIEIASSHSNQKMRMGEEAILIIEIGSIHSNMVKPPFLIYLSESNLVVSTIKNSVGVKCL